MVRINTETPADYFEAHKKATTYYNLKKRMTGMQDMAARKSVGMENFIICRRVKSAIHKL